MKQIKEEKAKKQRDEEKQRLMAMRERKAEKINKITGNILESIIRVFIKSEIKEIYSIESESIAAENIQENNEEKRINIRNGLFWPGTGTSHTVPVPSDAADSGFQFYRLFCTESGYDTFCRT